MSIPGAASPLFIGAAAADAAAFKIDRSLRFNSSDSSDLRRQPSSSSNRRTFTISFWVKRSKLGSNQRILSTASNEFIRFESNDTFLVFETFARLRTDQVFRDTSSWYHFVVAVDTTQSTASNRVKFYVNGAQVTDFSTETYPSQNDDSPINYTTQHQIGSGTVEYFDGYLADFFLIDGSQLDPTSFGAYDDNGVWQSAAYSGTFGTNGFHLKFADNSSNAALGTDSSGNGNTFTVNNFAVAATGDSSATSHFDIVTYTGTGSELAISSLGFQPDFVWIKQRETRNNLVFDSVRGATKFAVTNSTGVPGTGAEMLKSFDSNGFTLGTSNDVNQSGGTYVAWCWKAAGGTTSSNTNGTITSSVTANAAYGFSIVTYEGNGSIAQTVGHGLSTAPELIIAKNIDYNIRWPVFHTSVGGGNALILNDETAPTGGTGIWGNTSPTSSVFTIANDGESNKNGDTYIAYCFAPVSGFSKFGSYSGGTNPKTITTGFKPAFLLIKRSDGSNEWIIIDSKRGGTKKLSPSLNVAENDGTYLGGDSSNTVEFLADGFKLTSTNAETNGSGQTHVYAAFAGAPDSTVIDSLIDTPTNYTVDSGNAGGNYAVMNPLTKFAADLANGNLEVTGNRANDWSLTIGTIGITSGKFYWEYTVDTVGSTQIGICQHPSNDKLGVDAKGYGYILGSGRVDHQNTDSAYGDSLSAGDVLGIAYDADGGNLYFYKNGTIQNSGTAAATGIASATWFPGISIYGDFDPGAGKGNFNFGQRPFAISSIPTGYKSLCTQNLADPTITDGSTAFDAILWTGNGSTQSITGLSFSPDLVWYKCRSSASNLHGLFDTVRGASKQLYSSNTNTEATYSGVSAFNSDGFDLGSDNGGNQSSQTYVGWAWDAGSSTVSNTDGSITSNVRANATAGFSVVTYSGDGSTSGSVGHGLNAAPGMVIVKARNATKDWKVAHSSLSTQYMFSLNTTSQQGIAGWNGMNNSVFYPARSGDTYNNTSGDNYVAYCFAPVEGYSAFGDWTGNSSSGDNQPFIYCGFRPAFIMWVKYAGQNDNRFIFDTARNPYNRAENWLNPNTNSAETSDVYNRVDILSNGFKLRVDNAAYGSNTSHSFLFYAVAENPFQANGGLAR